MSTIQPDSVAPPEMVAAEQLRHAEERWRLAVCASSDVVRDWDPRSGDIEWSDALRIGFGWDPEGARTARDGAVAWWRERVHPEDRERVVAGCRAALANPDVDQWEMEYRFRRADGGWASVVERAFIMRDGAGAATRAVVSMRDASAQTRSLAALRRSEERFRALVEASTSAVWRTDPRGLIREDIPGWRAITGLTFEETRGRGWLRVVHPDDVESSKVVWLQARETATPFEVEQRIRTADGTYRWFRCRGVPVLDGTGRPREWIGMHEDIDDRRRREAAERFLSRATVALNGSLDYDATLQTLADLTLEELADGCVVHMTRPDGGFDVAAVASRDPVKAAITRQMETHFPSRPDAPIGHPHVVRTGRPQLIPHLGEEALRSFAISEEHLDLIRVLGVHSGMCVPIVGESGILGAMTIVSTGATRDRVLGERELVVAEELGRRAGRAVEHARDYRDTSRARQEAEHASRAKSDFLAVLSHEIRTPLNAIVGYAQLLADAVTAPVTEQQQSQLRRIVSSAEHLRVLIDEILELSRIEAGREEVRLEPVELRGLVDSAMDVVSLPAQAKGLRLVRDVPAIPCVVTTDRTKLLQALVNLASNAVKYTERGEVAFTLRALPGRAEIEVRDTGVGIAPEDQRRIYEPFWQVDQRRTHAAGGTGLGLSVVRHLMQLLGGGVRAESRPGEGSRFTVWVPVEGDG